MANIDSGEPVTRPYARRRPTRGLCRVALVMPPAPAFSSRSSFPRVIFPRVILNPIRVTTLGIRGFDRLQRNITDLLPHVVYHYILPTHPTAHTRLPL